MLKVARGVSPLALTVAAALVVAFAAPGYARRAAPAASTVVPAHVEALLINGGGTPSANYQSHLRHVRELVGVLRWSGIPERHVTILAGDGPDPAADLALREAQPEEDFWLVTGTRLERAFRTPVTHESSRVDGFSLRPATASEIGRWFTTTGKKLGRGDTLLLYVTDHGTKNADDTRDNRITLWGKGAALSVGELRAQLATLDRRVKVVMLMSQCYSGSFANLAWPDPSRLPEGNVCGYFSTTAERPSYGCYPENRDLDDVGHSFDFIQELATSGSFRNAHLRVLHDDMTPDVPLRTSDFFIEELLRKRAVEKGKEYTAFVDSLLAEAWRHRGQWEPEIRLLDAIGRDFGWFSPRSLGEIEEQTARLAEVSRQLTTHGKAWKAAFGDANQANLDRFLEKRTDWAEQVGPRALEAGMGGARDLAGLFLYDLAEHTRTDSWMSTRLATLRGKADRAKEASYRMEVRLGVVLRMRTILATIAGRVYLALHGSRAERQAYDSLVGCEAISLPLPEPLPGRRPLDRSPFPPLDDDLRVAREVLPAWMGIRFREPPEAARTAQDLTRGAASVLAVYPDSPAEEAGLQAGDVVLGPPGAHFEDRRQIREWTMLATVDKPAPLDVFRGEERLEVTLVPRPYPVRWPELPGPLRAMNTAPPWKPLGLTAYRGELPSDLRGSGPHLLYFWATWCGPCKAALPELVAFERERKVPVIAITDESAATLDRFFGSFAKTFPERVATDEHRKAFQAYGVSGTPTFVLVDGAGIVASYSTGYSPAKRLGVEGWRWSAAPASP